MQSADYETKPLKPWAQRKFSSLVLFLSYLCQSDKKFPWHNCLLWDSPCNPKPKIYFYVLTELLSTNFTLELYQVRFIIFLILFQFAIFGSAPIIIILSHMELIVHNWDIPLINYVLYELQTFLMWQRGLWARDMTSGSCSLL